MPLRVYILKTFFTKSVTNKAGLHLYIKAFVF